MKAKLRDLSECYHSIVTFPLPPLPLCLGEPHIDGEPGDLILVITTQKYVSWQFVECGFPWYDAMLWNHEVSCYGGTWNLGIGECGILLFVNMAIIDAPWFPLCGLQAPCV